MSKEKGWKVMEQSLFLLEFQLPDRKDVLQTPQMFSIKSSIILQTLSAVYMLSRPPFIS